MDDGLTRDSLSDHGNQESIPPTDPPVPSVGAMHHRKRSVRHYHRSHFLAAHQQSEVAVVKKNRRNPVESFVYAWNGWVIRTFHTKTGTVLLGHIGAKV